MVDLSNKRFGRLVVLEYAGKTVWKCRCDCGNYKLVTAGHLKDGHTKSCGCLKNKYRAKNKRLLSIWRNMLERCDNENRRDSKYYHDKGITVCEEWRDYKKFEEWALNNGYSDNLTIDRVDENGNYEPSNCQWITISEQQKRRSSNIWIEHNGEIKILSDWAREYGINRATLKSRLEMGYTFEGALKKKPRINRTSIIVNYNGEEMNIAQLSEKLGVSVAMISKELKQGISIEKVIERAIEVKKRRKAKENLTDEKLMEYYKSDMKSKDICGNLGISESYYHRRIREIKKKSEG